MHTDHDEFLDARGLICPLPVLKAQKRLRGMASGKSLLVLCTDPKAPDDLKELAAERGYSFHRLDDDENASRILLSR